MRLTDADALSFDCYGTLINWEAGIASVLSPWASAHHLHLSVEELLERYAVVEARQEELTPRALYPDILDAAMRSLGTSLGIDVSDEESKRLATSVPDWPAFPDSPSALAKLATRYKLVILSNIDRQSFAASNARLGVHFDAILTAQDIGSYKPSPRNFEVLVDTVHALGVGDGRLLHVAQKSLSRPRPGETARVADRVDRPAWRARGMGCDASAGDSGATGFHVLVDGRLRGRLFRDGQRVRDAGRSRHPSSMSLGGSWVSGQDQRQFSG